MANAALLGSVLRMFDFGLGLIWFVVFCCFVYNMYFCLVHDTQLDEVFSEAKQSEDSGFESRAGFTGEMTRWPNGKASDYDAHRNDFC